ncbi:inositol monophosphatase family protein [Aestuariimicrobium sp. Y1814]|uniref:inositol monophosphatase family protein n=1 Tax=Aestuariimicrobium sp. Y1814 TaxID=3418742 RepID=UPI003DA77379
MSVDERYESALTVLRAAAERGLDWFQKASLDVEHKGDGSPVTAADRDLESFLRAELGALFPEDGFLGEEFPETPGTSGGRWIADPIDGTKSFIHGTPLWTTLLAYETAEGVQFGAISCPATGQLVYAQRGKGCFDQAGRRVSASKKTDLDGAYVMASWLEQWPLPLIDQLQSGGTVVRTWGDAFGYLLVAQGHAEAMVDFEVSPFDIAPMPVILEEAGAVFTDLAGERSIYNGHSIGAATPEIHQALLARLQAASQS